MHKNLVIAKRLIGLAHQLVIARKSNKHQYAFDALVLKCSDFREQLNDSLDSSSPSAWKKQSKRLLKSSFLDKVESTHEEFKKVREDWEKSPYGKNEDPVVETIKKYDLLGSYLSGLLSLLNDLQDKNTHSVKDMKNMYNQMEQDWLKLSKS